jgi:hypothetical protein
VGVGMGVGVGVAGADGMVDTPPPPPLPPHAVRPNAMTSAQAHVPSRSLCILPSPLKPLKNNSFPTEQYGSGMLSI